MYIFLTTGRPGKFPSVPSIVGPSSHNQVCSRWTKSCHVRLWLTNFDLVRPIMTECDIFWSRQTKWYVMSTSTQRKKSTYTKILTWHKKNQLITSISDPTDVKKGSMWACRLVSFPIMNEYLIGKKHECDFNQKNIIVILLKIGGPSTCLQFSLGLSSWLSVM